jgi:hypothetical protein
MSSVVEQVAAAVTAELEIGEAAGAFSRAIQTERAYDTEMELEDTNIISVLCVPMVSKRRRESGGGPNGGTWIRDVRLEILVRKRYSQSDYDASGKIVTASIDPYVELLEQIDNYLADSEHEVLTTMPTAEYTEPTEKNVDREIVKGCGVYWFVKHLKDYHQFTGLIRVAYSVTQAY